MRRTEQLVWAAVLLTALPSCETCKGTEEKAQRNDGSSKRGDFTDQAPDDASTWTGTPEVLEVVNPSKLPAYDGPTGSVEGAVTVFGDPAPIAKEMSFGKCPEAAATYAKAFREGPPTDGGGRPLADAFVAVTGYSAFLPEKRATRVVEFRGCAASTRTIDLTFGQRIEFINHDRVSYAPTIFGERMAALRVVPPNGQSVFLELKRPGSFLIGDGMGNAWMSFNVFVVGYPLHAVTAPSGYFRIDGVPIGSLTVHARHPAIDAEATRAVEVRAGVIERVDLAIEHRIRSAKVADAGAKDAGGK